MCLAATATAFRSQRASSSSVASTLPITPRRGCRGSVPSRSDALQIPARMVAQTMNTKTRPTGPRAVANVPAAFDQSNRRLPCRGCCRRCTLGRAPKRGALHHSTRDKRYPPYSDNQVQRLVVNKLIPQPTSVRSVVDAEFQECRRADDGPRWRLRPSSLRATAATRLAAHRPCRPERTSSSAPQARPVASGPPVRERLDAPGARSCPMDALSP
jgi:hypothetical protein